jgi:hypothetical protein
MLLTTSPALQCMRCVAHGLPSTKMLDPLVFALSPLMRCAAHWCTASPSVWCVRCVAYDLSRTTVYELCGSWPRALGCEVHWCLRPHPQWDVWFMSVHCLPRTFTHPLACLTGGCWHLVLASAPFSSHHFSNAAPGSPIWSIDSASLAFFNNLLLIRWKLSTTLTRGPLRQSSSYSIFSTSQWIQIFFLCVHPIYVCPLSSGTYIIRGSMFHHSSK